MADEKTEDKVAVQDENGKIVYVTWAEYYKILERERFENSPYNYVEDPVQFNYSLKPYVVRGGKNVIHRTNFMSCNSAQYIYDYLDFDTVEEAIEYGAEHFPEMGGFRKCKRCFGGKGFFKSDLDKAGILNDAEAREKMWEEDWEENKE